ncbi:hypothetical protein Btru_075490 [Bulinus truncatus]|nr:hypothetical protein Btru_075490 [Bulinus truncatus]
MAAKRWSKEDLDSTFEEFLNFSGSKGDVTEKINELLNKKESAKSSALWWADSDEDVSQKGGSKTFLKGKNYLESPVRAKSSSSRSSVKMNHGNKLHTNSASKVSDSKKQSVATKSKIQKDQMKPKNMNSPLKTRPSKSRTEVTMSKDSLEDISEKSEEHLVSQGKSINPFNIPLHESSVESTASYEVPVTNTSHGQPGCDTLDELADKHNFFQNLEEEADGTVDYGRLNQDLSQTGGTTLLSPAVRMDGNHTDATGLQADAGDPATVVENTEKNNEPQQKNSMLSKVALLDSMDSTFNTTTSPQVPNSRETTQDNLFLTAADTLKNPGHMGTNTSKEMEALQRVLQEAEMSPTLYGVDSRPPTGKINVLSSTPLYEKRDVDRSVGEIIREIDAIAHKGGENDNYEVDLPLRSDYKTPKSPKFHVKSKSKLVEELLGFENSLTSNNEGYYRPVTSIGIKDKKRIEKKFERKEPRPNSVPVYNERAMARSMKDKFSHIQSSGYGRSTSPPTCRKSRSLSAGKSPPKGQKSSPDQAVRDVTKKLDQSPSSYLRTSEKENPMLQSTDVFAKLFTERLPTSKISNQNSWLKDNPGTDSNAPLLEILKVMREQLEMEKTLKTNLQVDLIAQEKEFQRKLENQKLNYEDEILKLKQENFVLAAKLKESNAIKHAGDSSSNNGETRESKETRLEREIKEQENLLAGYQAENKRLYEEIKNIQKQAKATESSMFKENQRLTLELSNVKQELELKNSELQNKGIITSMAVQQQIAAGNAEAMMGASRVAHLEGELSEAKRVQDNLSKELKMAQQNRYEFERHLENLLRERDALARQLSESLTPDQVKELELKHKQELDRLNKKLKWYVENQELLDKSNAKLRQKDDEISRLKMRLEDFKSEAGRKLEENKIRAKEKAADAKKIQDLERQVKEMEQVIRRRHPNSLPAMMMVAANAPDVIDDVGQTKGRSVQVLENRIRKLEKELEAKDELSQQDLRAMEQKYNQVKLQFEERIADLERQLLYCQLSGEGFKERPHSHAIALERELESVKDRCRKQVMEMQAEVDRLTAELIKARKNQENMMKNDTKQSETDKQQLLGLQMELKNKDHDIQLLQHTVDKLLSRSGKKSNQVKNNLETKVDQSTIQVLTTNREYRPGVFADSDLSSLIQENHLLKSKIDDLQLELDQQSVDLRKCLAETESVARQNQERLENQINALRSSHQKELQKILSEHALLSSSSKVAELQSKCDTQEVMIRHLQSQLKKLNLETEQLPHLKARESQLMKKIEELQDKLKEARMVQAPEMRHFESLEEKLSDLVIRQKKREAELDTVVKHNQTIGRSDLEEEVEKWKKMVDVKNQQLQVFRAELDSILEVLKTLQRQGVTLPVGTHYN